jgi:hypothetical protein
MNQKPKKGKKRVQNANMEVYSRRFRGTVSQSLTKNQYLYQKKTAPDRTGIPGILAIHGSDLISQPGFSNFWQFTLAFLHSH